MRLPSSTPSSQQRSINLAISHRGLAALQAINPAAMERFMQEAIPMRGRMIHRSNGELDSQLYDRDGQVCVLRAPQRLFWPVVFTTPQCINSIDRALLNEELLDEAAALPNIRIYFKHKVISADFEQKTITLQDLESNNHFSTGFDFCIGADGSYSVIRRQMMRVVR